jgi:hypothetical protein
MSTEHDEQSLELTYLDETIHTIQLVLYDDSDKENQTPNIRSDKTTELERTAETGSRTNSVERTGDSMESSIRNQIHQDLPTDIEPDRRTSPTEDTGIMGTIQDVQNDDISHQALREIPLKAVQTNDQRPGDQRPSQERDERTHHTRTITNNESYRSFEHLRTADEVFD